MSRIFDVKFADDTYEAWYCDEPDEAIRALNFLQDNVILGIDTETMALPQYKHISNAALSPHLSTIRLIQIFDGTTSIIIDWLKCKSKEVRREIRSLLKSRKFIAHNAIFDLAFLKKVFNVKKINIGCTFIGFKLLAHAARESDEGLRAGLDAVVKGFYAIDIAKANQVSDWSIPDLLFEQIEYSALDPICVVKIAEKIAPALEKFKLYDFYNLLKDVQHPISEMHLNGIGFDSKKHRELTATWRDGLYEAKKTLLSQTGLPEITGPKIAAWLEKNLSVEWIDIWPRTESGSLKTDAIAFSDFGNIMPEIKAFGAFQKFKTLTADFGSKLLQEINEESGRLHPQYHICGTRTGRLSCSKPNLQQSPRDKNFRSQFVPSPGNVFVGADYSMIELRVAAEVSRDKVMLDAFRKGKDLHTVLGSQIAGTDITKLPEKEFKRIRQMAKNTGFGCIYGIGAKKFASYAKKISEDSAITEDTASELIKVFRKTYSGYRQWHLALYEKCLETLRVRTVCGKLRKLAPEYCYGAGANTVIQGSAAGCMLWSLILFQQEVDKGLPAELVATIHDELIVQCNTKDAKNVKRALEECMIAGFKKVFPKGVTKNLVEAKIGNSWDAIK